MYFCRDCAILSLYKQYTGSLMRETVPRRPTRFQHGSQPFCLSVPSALRRMSIFPFTEDFLLVSIPMQATLDYDFSEEKKFSYRKLSMDEIIHHLAVFISGLWQIHAFGEENLYLLDY